MKSIFKISMIMVGITMSLSAFTVPQIKPGEVLRADQTLRNNITTQPPTLDPNNAYDNVSAYVIQNMFATLVKEDLEGKIIPYAAESWDISPDGKTYTFYLRKDGKWSNGEPVTAGDFVYSWQRLSDPNIASPAQAYLAPLFIENIHEVIEGKLPLSALGVKAIDDYTFQVTLSKPAPWFLSALPFSGLTPIYKPVVEKYGIEWTRPENIVVNGPYIISEMRVNEKLVLTKNPHYWDTDKVIINKVVSTMISNSQQVYRSFKAGELDTAGVPKNDYQDAVNSGNMHIAKSFFTWAYAFNVKLVPDIRIRKAITLALDNKLIIEKVIRNQQVAGQSWTPDYIQGAEYVKPSDIFNIPQAERNKQAIELLTQAGYSKANPYRITLSVASSESADVKQTRVAIQNVLDTNTGGLVKLELVSYEWKIFVEKQLNNEFAFAQAGWVADYNHISNFLTIFAPPSQANYSDLNDPIFNDLLERANAEPDEDKRNRLYAQAEHQLVNVNYALVPFQWIVGLSVRTPELKGTSDNALYNYIEDRYFIDLKKSTIKK